MWCKNNIYRNVHKRINFFLCCPICSSWKWYLWSKYFKAWTLVAKCGFCLGPFIHARFQSCNVTFVIVSAFLFLLFEHTKCANNPRLNKNCGQIQHKAAPRMQQQLLCSSMSTGDCKCLTGKLKEKEKKKKEKKESIQHTKGCNHEGYVDRAPTNNPRAALQFSELPKELKNQFHWAKSMAY